MQIRHLITRAPRVFNQDRGAEARAAFDDLDPALRDLMAGAAGSSPYLHGLMQREAEWLRPAFEDVDAAVRAEIEAVADWTSATLSDDLRRAKRRVAVMTALADLGGVWSLEQVTGALTDLADTACQSALRAGVAVQIKRGKLPGMGPDDIADAAGMAVLAMGKMGAHELNYSSDIDLICLFDETRFERDDFMDARASFVRATRAMSSMLNDLTGNGYVFRTDLRLRPDPAVTPVCMSMEAAERYYESLGRTWERGAYIKARAAAGDVQAGTRFLKALQPFVWRRHLDFAAIQDAHDMRLAIREHKGLGGPITLPGHNMKLGRGGIREIEFFTQTRQLIAGGRDRDLRLRGTVEGLDVLADKGWVARDIADTLSDHYRAHRTVEHRIQMTHDAQTHNLPNSENDFERLACLMDMDLADLQKDLLARLSAVHDMTEGFFAPDSAASPPDQSFDTKIVQGWYRYAALRTDRGAELFEKLKPDLLARLMHSSKPDEALRDFDGFLSGLPAGVQFFSLLQANPQLLDLLVDIVCTSPELSQHLSRNAGVFDAVIGGEFFSEWPGQKALQTALSAELTAEQDYETKLDLTRRWNKEWHFRIGVHHLRGLTEAAQTATQYADLARAVLMALWPVVTDQFATRHGPPPGRGAVLLGMGSLGTGRLTSTSDLDMIVIYDSSGVEASDGPRALPSRVYYARLTQAMITAMTVPMSQGKLYEVDMRLRPSGNQGPVATSLQSFQSYQRDEAWLWEHLALTRAEVIAGPADLAQEVEAFRTALLATPRDVAHVAREVAEMRARIQAAKPADTVWDTKIGPGRLQEIELIAQAGSLLEGEIRRDVDVGLDATVASGLLDAAGVKSLKESYAMLWKLQLAARLLSADVLAGDELGQAGLAFLLRATGAESLAALKSTLDQTYATADTVISDALQAQGAVAAEGKT
ncbi:MAG: glutamine-synthetase adenylyltransferase [Sulfitobacter sp.]